MSAKTGEGVRDVFLKAVDNIMRRSESKIKAEEDQEVKLREDKRLLTGLKAHTVHNGGSPPIGHAIKTSEHQSE